MKTLVSAFSRTSRIFDNARHALLTLHDIEFPPAGRLIQTSSQLFQMLDRAEPTQAEVLRRLWVIRSSVLFTILPFDSPELGLSVQVNELEQLCEGLPETKVLVQSLKKCVTEVLNVSRNPKRDWVINMALEAREESDSQFGILSALAAGRVPGWPRERTHLLTDLGFRVLAIGSRADLRSNIFSRVILPCACINVPEKLLSDLIFGGVSARFDVLLYSNERFHAPRRLMLPCNRMFESHIQNSEIEREVIKVEWDPVLSAIDTWVNDAFWQGVHGAPRSISHGLLPARYMLSLDGAGVFLPESGRVTTLPADGRLTDERDLCTVRVEELAEGDVVVFRSGSSGVLLDHASDRIIGRTGNEDLLEAATNWKTALDALLVTHSAEDVCQALSERGVSASAATINRWVGPEVLGPGSPRVFRELICLLASKGKIQRSGSDLICYADSSWESLQALRAVHHKAGSLIRHDLFNALFNRFKAGGDLGALSDRERIHIDGDTDAELIILRVASVDNITAYVPHLRLGKIDDLKGNKWLG